MSDIKLLIILYFKESLFNLKIKTIYIKVFNIFNNFGLKIKIKIKVFEKNGFIIKSLTEALYKTVYLRSI